MEVAKNYEFFDHHTTIVSLTGDTALISIIGHDSHPDEGNNANYAYSCVSTSLSFQHLLC